jgi:cysteine-rich repeat protein
MHNYKKLLTLVMAVAVFAWAGCNQGKPKRSLQELVKPVNSQFETITETPHKNLAQWPSEPRQDVPYQEGPSSSSYEEVPGGSYPEQDDLAEFTIPGQAPIDFPNWGEIGVGGGPGPFPPIPTDDELLADDEEGVFCLNPVCGDGKVQGTEQCDDGNQINNDGCNILCRLPYCGNGVTEANEQCDDGNNISGDGCSAFCSYELFGNGQLDPGEQCDDGNKIAGDGCSPCGLYERCGNGVIDPGETCDDGNRVSGDGCSDFCQLENLCRSQQATFNWEPSLANNASRVCHQWCA